MIVVQYNSITYTYTYTQSSEEESVRFDSPNSATIKYSCTVFKYKYVERFRSVHLLYTKQKNVRGGGGRRNFCTFLYMLIFVNIQIYWVKMYNYVQLCTKMYKITK